MAKKKSRSRKPVVRKVATNCVFCKGGKEPNYKDYESLKKYLSDRSKIIGKDRSGVCSRHQRVLSKEIKRARHLGLLAYTPDF